MDSFNHFPPPPMEFLDILDREEPSFVSSVERSPVFFPPSPFVVSPQVQNTYEPKIMNKEELQMRQLKQEIEILTLEKQLAQKRLEADKIPKLNQSAFASLGAGPRPRGHRDDPPDPHATLSAPATKYDYASLPKIPLFDGNPRVWPLFIQTLMDTTHRLSISDSDNMARLLESLKGVAKRSVEHLLYNPVNFRCVIESLETKFGNQQVVANAAINRILELPKVAPDLENLSGFANEVSQVRHTLLACGMERDVQGSYLMMLLEQKLTPTLSLLWGQEKKRAMDFSGIVDLNVFTRWIEECGQQICTVYGYRELQPTKSREPVVGRVHVQQQKRDGNNLRRSNRCPIGCVDNHPLFRCLKFLDLAPCDRLKKVQGMNRCENCLATHSLDQCESLYRCARENCQEKHNALLHGAFTENIVTSIIPVNSRIHFKIIPVMLYNHGKQIQVNAFLDEGSSVSLLSRRVAELLELRGPEERLQLKWTDGGVKVEKCQRVSMEISAVDKTSDCFLVQNVRTVEHLDLPKLCITEKEIELFGLTGYFCPDYDNKPDLLIGLEHANLLMSLESRGSPGNDLIASRTCLGWAIYGRGVDNNCVSAHRSLCQQVDQKNDGLHILIREPVLQESFGVNDINKSPINVEETPNAKILEEGKKKLLIEKRKSEGSKTKSSIKKSGNNKEPISEKDLRNKLINKYQNAQEFAKRKEKLQRVRDGKGILSELLVRGKTRSSSIDTNISNDSILSDEGLTTKKKKKKRIYSGSSSSSPLAERSEKTNEKPPQNAAGTFPHPSVPVIFNPETAEWVSVFPYAAPFSTGAIRPNFYHSGYSSNYGDLYRKRGQGSYNDDYHRTRSRSRPRFHRRSRRRDRSSSQTRSGSHQGTSGSKKLASTLRTSKSPSSSSCRSSRSISEEITLDKSSNREQFHSGESPRSLSPKQRISTPDQYPKSQIECTSTSELVESSRKG